MGIRVPAWLALTLCATLAGGIVAVTGVPGAPVLAAPAPQATSCATATAFSAIANGNQEVPAVTTTAWAWVNLQLNAAGTEVTITVNSTNLPLAEITQAHIHSPAPVGTNAAVTLGFFSGPTGSFTNPYSITLPIPASVLDHMRTNQAYVNIHSTAFPGGLIRGQVTCGTVTPPTALTTSFATVLNGGQEVPPVITPGIGTATVELDGTGTNAFVIINTSGLTLTTVTAAHIHAPARPGVNAGIVVNLFTGPTGTFTSPYSVSVAIPPGLLQQMRNGEAYINVHTVQNPGGEVRGQLGAVPGAASGGGGGGSASPVPPETPPVIPEFSPIWLFSSGLLALALFALGKRQRRR